MNYFLNSPSSIFMSFDGCGYDKLFRCIVVGAVAVGGVAVVVTVTGAIAGGSGVCAVEDDGDVAIAAVGVQAVDFGEH